MQVPTAQVNIPWPSRQQWTLVCKGLVSCRTGENLQKAGNKTILLKEKKLQTLTELAQVPYEHKLRELATDPDLANT